MSQTLLLSLSSSFIHQHGTTEMQTLSHSRLRVKIFSSISGSFSSRARVNRDRTKILAAICQVATNQHDSCLRERHPSEDNFSIIRAHTVQTISCDHGPKVEPSVSRSHSWSDVFWKISACKKFARSRRRHD